MAQKRLSKFKVKELIDKGYRKCVVCKEVKSLDLFYKSKNRKGGYAYECKKCKNELHRKYMQTEKAKKSGCIRSKKYREKNKKRLLNQRYLKNYGITTDEKMDLLKQQNYHCKICGNKVNMISGHIDHNHKTGKVRGILCRECNTAIGLFKDNINNLKRAIKYLSIQNVSLLKK